MFAIKRTKASSKPNEKIFYMHFEDFKEIKDFFTPS